MAAGFSVKDALNKNSKAGIDESPRARFRTKDISIFKMYRNDMNFYSVEQVEELAGDILMYGLKQNLELVYAPCEKGEYRIVAGERRWEALKYLVSKGYKEFELATSKLTTPQDNDEEQVEIIIANAYRTKTTSDMIEEETRLKASLERMKAAGKKIKGYDLQSGRLRDVISSMLHVSKTKIAQIEAVNNNLIPEWKEELKGERLTFSAAYELSGMTADEQREALGKFTETGELTHKDVKDMKAEKAAGQQVSESDTETEIGMNPPEVRAGDEYETPHPEGITSICYSCTEYETCNVKTGTCTSCDQYKKKDIRITAAGQGNRFEDIECQLLGERGKGWKELIAGAIDNAYEKMIATTPPTTEEEQTHCEMIKEAVKGMFINESRTAAEVEFIKTHIVDYEKIFDVCMNGDDLEFKKGLVRLQKMQNEYVMQREND